MSLTPGPNAKKRIDRRKIRKRTPKASDSGSGNGSTQADNWKGVRGKRANSTIRAIREKQAEGKAHGKERAVVRVGVETTNILTGQEDLSEWTDEELEHGQRKDRNGRFQGRPKQLIPKPVYDEMVRRTLSRAQELMRSNLEMAIQMLIGVITGKDVEDRDRLKAIEMVMNRVMGKEPVKVEMDGGMPPWIIALQQGIVSVNSDSVVVPDEGDDDEDVIDV